MSRIFLWRLLYVLVLIGCIVQLIGFFSPYHLIINPVTHTIVEADSYWVPLAQLASGKASSPFLSFLSLFILATILQPMIMVGIELAQRPRSFSGARISGFIFALLGSGASGCWGFFSAVFWGCNVSDVPRYCVLHGDFGAGFWPSFTGSLVSTTCLIALLILGMIWWDSIPNWRVPLEKPRRRMVEQ